MSSSVWENFIKLDSDSARCKQCNKVLKCKGFSTSGLIRHLTHVHKTSTPQKRKVELDCSESSKKPCARPITELLVKKETCQEIISKLVAVDGFTINGVTRSDFIRTAIRDRGFKLPKNPSDVKNKILLHHSELIDNTKFEIKKLIEEENKFAITFDEYTSVRNRRYLNINLHGADAKVWCLGLVRVSGSLPADKVSTFIYLRTLDRNSADKCRQQTLIQQKKLIIII